MLKAVIILAVLGGVFGAILAVASKKLAVETDPRVDSIMNVLPCANCGACGYPGCAGLADAIVNAGAPINACIPGGDEITTEIAKIMGMEPASGTIRKVAQLNCNGTPAHTKKLYEYKGVKNCHLAVTQFGGPNTCHYSCVGLGSCEKACPFDAIHIGPDELPVVNYDTCTGCGVCVQQCPQLVLSLVPVNKQVHIRCNNHDKGKEARGVCEVSCISCGICVKACPEQAITLVPGKATNGNVAVIDYEKCINCDICVEKCPRKSIHMDPPIDPDLTVVEGPQIAEGCASCSAKNVYGL